MLDAENLMGFVFASPASWGKSVKKFVPKVITEQTVLKSAIATNDQIQFAIQHSGASADPDIRDQTVTFPRSASSRLKKVS